MGVDDDFSGIGATTSSLFCARLVLCEDDRHLFEKTLAKAVATDVHRGKLTAIIDSSPVNGAGADGDTYDSVRAFSRRSFPARAMGCPPRHVPPRRPTSAASPTSTGRTKRGVAPTSFDPELREVTEEAGVDLATKVPPVTNASRFSKTDFAIGTKAATVTCPAGVTTTEAKAEKDHKGRPGRRFSFPRQTFAACTLRERCVKGDKAGRSTFVSGHEDRIAAAKAAQEEAEIKALLRRRSKIERKIDHLQDLGMRKSCYRGRRRTTLQVLLVVTVATFRRLFVLGAFDTTPATAIAA